MTLATQTFRRRLLFRKAAADGDGTQRIIEQEQPLRAELFSVDQLEQHAKALAGWHEIDPRRGPDRLLPRLAENEQILLGAYELVSGAVEKGRRIAPAAEWLLDNFYLIEEQIRTARKHLPRGYSRELPRLLNGPQAGSPRVYDIALELISHIDGRVDAESLSSFVAAYQTVTPLKLGELWAIPIMLRLALIENLRRVAARVAAGRTDRDRANDWADQLTETAEKDPKSLILVMADMARSNPPMSSAFVAEFARRLQGQSPALAFPLTWIEQRLGEQGLTIEQLVQTEGQHQAGDQVSIGNSIGSLRFLAAMDWREFVETMSVVEHTLRGDPADVYTNMDFATRDRYRHVVERCAKHSPLSEDQVARTAIALARESRSSNGTDDRTGHVGYYLIDKGLPQLERAAKVRLTLGQRLTRIARAVPLLCYLGSIAGITAAASGLLLYIAARLGIGTAGQVGLGVLIVICTSQLAMALVNWLSTLLIRPHALPRMDFSAAIPAEARTVVAVPTMLTSPEAVAHLLEGLEVRYLANRDDNLHFALLTDFRDAPQETMPEDEHLLRLAREGIEALNEKYRRERVDVFYLLHRPRKWNEKEQVWMGYERKRGKLAALNAVLRGHPLDESFSLVVGRAQWPQRVRFVITLDTDTQLPRDAARQLVGTIAHPLNRPVFDETRGRCTDGYTILQPRVAISLPTARRSLFVRLFGGEPGIDPYTREVSDVYQDVFREGSFIGKGIYDVDAFELTLKDRLPENLILSHDLLEGCHARAAVVSDVQLYEEYPSRYTSDVSRRHRWIRGDWQIAWWLLPRVPAWAEQWTRNPLSILSRWKIFDNLRRSLVSASLLALLLLGWIVLPHPLVWTVAILGIVLLPPLLSSMVEIVRKPGDLPLDVHLWHATQETGRQFASALFALVFLPYDAYFSLDAVIRTLVRVLVTKKRLLEWQTSSDSEKLARTDFAGFYRTMWIAPALAAAVAMLVVLIGRDIFAYAAPLLIAWALAPGIAWFISRPAPAPGPRLGPTQIEFLQKLSRRTWRFFETFVTAADNWLPPDNYQEQPVEVTAHRTSPTNIGCALLANLAAYDFGYISAKQLIERTGKTLDTMERLERFRGHFYNWYDTRNLQPLQPLYVSTVDSGNLAGHLLTLRPGLIELADLFILPRRTFGGIADTLRVVLELATDPAAIKRRGGWLPPDALTRLGRFVEELNTPPRTLAASRMLLQRLLLAAADVVAALGPHVDEEIRWWATAFDQQTRDALGDFDRIAPWVQLPPPIEHLWRRGSSAQIDRLSELRQVLRQLDNIPTLREVAALDITILPVIDQIVADLPITSDGENQQENDWIVQLRKHINAASSAASERISALEKLAQRCAELADMQWDFLFDRSRDLLAIGYNITDRRRDDSYYDLLASEARLCSFIAIAQGHLPQDHWFALGRLLTTAGGEPTLLSWSGSMFEYLMPLLVMPSYEGTLLDQTCRAMLRRQIEYGQQRGVPWGISESGYNTTDVHLNYQYRAFGVPGLGFKRGLAEDLVIAPYASVMALMVSPEEATDNLQRMSREGFMGRYGFYEAIDYTPSRLTRGEDRAVIQSFMAHHEGMTFLSLAYLLLDRPMQRRFESDPLFKATELLLQERVPKAAPFFPHSVEVEGVRRAADEREALMRVFANPNTPIPEVHLLSNGRYQVMVTNAGGGYSRWKDLAVTRWREDMTRDSYGTFVYIRDVGSGEVWSATYQPTLKDARSYEAIFPQARAEYRRRDHDIDAHTEIAVSPEDDIELRRVTLVNRSRTRRVIELTSYAEVVLMSPPAEMQHPAFANLFVQTELVRGRQAILCTRRPRSQHENPPWMLHLMTCHGTTVGEASFETDRMKFIGRGRTVQDPEALINGAPLSDSEGSVLDPIVSVRRRIKLEPEETVKIDIVTGVAETRDAAMALIERYHDRRLADRVFDVAWTHSQVVLRQLNATEGDAQVYGRLASSVIYASSLRRAAPSIIAKNRRGQSGLWGYGISGDLPIVLLRIGDQNKIDLVRQLVQAHAYWRMKGLMVDLVIWNEDHSGYRQVLQDQIMGMIAAGSEPHAIDRPGGIFVRRADQMSEEDRILLQTVARAIITDSGGTLEEQIERRGRAELSIPKFTPIRARRVEPATAVEISRPDLVMFNGTGGFTRDGREYVITTAPGQVTPAPWSNVLANPYFGTVISESGSGYTWLENAHEFRLTPWYNDPVCDSAGEALYIRDEDTGRYWSPTPLPARGTMPYATRHGFGYSVFEYTENGITSELWVYVALHAPVKFYVLKLRNGSGRPRRLSVTGFFEWVLGDHRAKTLMHVMTEIDPKTGALFARNPYNPDFPERVAFVDVNEPTRSVSGDRTEFIGRNGSPASPWAMSRARLSGRVGAGLDPCAAMQVPFDLADGQEREIIFMLGAGQTVEDARGLIQKFRGAGPARRELEAVWRYWNHALGAVYVESPDPSINLLCNGWLLYQVLASRYWARSGYYQSGGAYGFRDQLQDVSALLHAEPRLIREHLVRCAAHQFREGDVQHWWHPPSGRGVRTHFSDDYLWLPLTACRYVNSIGDTGVLDERIHFIEGRPLKPEEESYYDLPTRSDESATLYEHCVRAIQRALDRIGMHGLPLIGCGDWNDGMNLIGEHGRGVSVWLGFFLHDVLTQFAQVARLRGDEAFATTCVTEARKLQASIESAAWDGQWYRRAFFDNGEALGSSANPECQIDSLPQSWAVLSGAGDPNRARLGMEQVDRRLVRREQKLIQLFDPPFDKSHLNPGYIKGYVPGVRENGGQYTHAAVWVAMAFAALRDRERAWELTSLINPINHGATADDIAVYKVEPYVIAADVYAVPPHTGRGGWTWYTGSAGWMYRLITESLLGLRLEVDKLRFEPCLPPQWKTFKLHYRYRETFYHITFKQTGGSGAGTVKRITIDGAEHPDKLIPLHDDRREHNVEVTIE